MENLLMIRREFGANGPRITLTGSRTTSPVINGGAARRCPSWIDQFVEYTSNLESAPIFRKWAAISAVAATLERKVWVTTHAPLYPNLYVFLVGPPGGGKSTAIAVAKNFIKDLPDPHIAPTSMTMASMVDCLAESKRTIISHPNPILEYNCLYIMADEWSALMHKYEDEIVAGLTTFYDGGEYGQTRRGKELRIKIARPCLNILAGTTPGNLLRTTPEGAWEEGYTTRIIMVYSVDKQLVNIFGAPALEMPEEMKHDLRCINGLGGEYGWDDSFAEAMHNWRVLGNPPVPNHPKLVHYCGRRTAHLLKLCLVSSADRSDSKNLTAADFNRALGWLIEAELNMPEIFRTGSGSTDSKAMDEILNFVQALHAKTKMPVSEREIIKFARERVPAHSVLRVIEIMERGGMIRQRSMDPKTGARTFTP